MKRPKNLWTYVKIALLAWFVITTFTAEPSPIDSGSSPPPYWLTIIPVVFLALFLPSLLRLVEKTERYRTASPWPAFPFSPFRDPLPFWHLCMWSAFAGSAPLTYQALTPYNHDRMVIALFMWSCGAGTLLGITRAKRGLKRKPEDTQESRPGS